LDSATFTEPSEALMLVESARRYSRLSFGSLEPCALKTPNGNVFHATSAVSTTMRIEKKWTFK
jgi:hypothetical protein